MADRRGARFTTIALVVVAATSMFGSILLLASSPYGTHASNDSFTYLGAAESLAHGEGWTYPFGDVGAPVTLFPPLYPLVLTVPELLGISTFHWVIWWNALFLAVLSLVVGVTVLRVTSNGVVAAVVAVLLVQLGFPTVLAYAHVWSEPIFYPLVIAILASISLHLASRKTRHLVVAAMLTSLAMLTRYAGLSVLVTVGVLLLGWPGRRLLDRTRALALYVGLALPLSAVWSIRNIVVSGTLTGNNELVHGLTVTDILGGLGTIASWFVPDEPVGGIHRFALLVAVMSLVLVVTVVLVAVARGRDRLELEVHPIVPVCLLFAVIHLAFIALANAFSTRAPPFNDRILGPAFAPLVVAAAVLGHSVWGRFRHMLALRVTVGAVAVAMVASAAMAATEYIPIRYGRRTNTAIEYRTWARALEPVLSREATLFSNRPNVAWFLVDRAIRSLPRSCRGGRVLPNPSYVRELRDLSVRLGDDPREVLVFRASKECAPFSVETLRRVLGLEPHAVVPGIRVLRGPAEPLPVR